MTKDLLAVSYTRTQNRYIRTHEVTEERGRRRRREFGCVVAHYISMGICQKYNPRKTNK